MPDETPDVVTITSRELYRLIERTENAAKDIAADVRTLTELVKRVEETAVDHEARLRDVERNRDLGRRVQTVERLVERLDDGLAKQGERIGRLEARDASRPNTVALAAVIAAFLSIAVNVVLYVIRI